MAQAMHQLKGDLTFASVPAIYAEQSPEFNAEPYRLDLSEVLHVDSAGLALLLEWTRQAAASGGRLVLTHVPDQLGSVIDVSGLDRILNIDS